MQPTIDFKAIVEELRRRLLNGEENTRTGDVRIEDKIRRLADLLDMDRNEPVDVIIAMLDEKWRRDGLIQ